LRRASAWRGIARWSTARLVSCGERFGFGASESYTGYPNYYTYSAPDTTFTGMLIGLGLEYAFLPNWTTKFEVDYLGFPNKEIPVTEYKEGYLEESYSYSISAQKVLFKFGVNL
jgi:opacity protein-like surface antigen